MLSKSSQSFQDRRAYIPPHIEKAMAQHMQQSMPAHLRKYAQSGTYVPAHIEKAMAQHMEKSMPAHMKQYAGAYMQQQVLSPRTAATAMPQSSAKLAPRPPVPNLLRRDHSQVSGEQFTVQTTGRPAGQATPTAVAAAAPYSGVPEQQPAPPQQVVYPQNQVEPQVPHAPEYDFIVNPDKPDRNKLSLPGGSSIAVRIGLIAGGLLVLLILFSVIRGLLSSGPSFEAFVSIAQKQQEIIHLVSNTEEQTNLNVSNRNFAATARLSVTSSQAATINYLQTNGEKVNLKNLNAAIDLTIDNRLKTASEAGNYNQTFKEIMQSQLVGYTNSLKQTYAETKGQKGRALLNDSYSQAQLLLIQLNEKSTN